MDRLRAVWEETESQTETKGSMCGNLTLFSRGVYLGNEKNTPPLCWTISKKKKQKKNEFFSSKLDLSKVVPSELCRRSWPPHLLFQSLLGSLSRAPFWCLCSLEGSRRNCISPSLTWLELLNRQTRKLHKSSYLSLWPIIYCKPEPFFHSHPTTTASEPFTCTLFGITTEQVSPFFLVNWFNVSCVCAPHRKNTNFNTHTHTHGRQRRLNCVTGEISVITKTWTCFHCVCVLCLCVCACIYAACVVVCLFLFVESLTVMSTRRSSSRNRHRSRSCSPNAIKPTTVKDRSTRRRWVFQFSSFSFIS